MEALTTIQIISSIVQLVEFGSKCVAKGVKIYQSNDGVLDENAAIEIAATHLTTLNNEVKNAAFSTSDQQLQDICSKVTEASSELLGVLECLKVQGTKTKWKSMRKAIQSILGKAKVKELEDKLGRFRDELNLQICVGTRQQLESLQTQVASCDDSDLRIKEILDAIVNGRDVFQSTVSDHNVLICGLHEETRRYIQQNHETTRLELRQVATHMAKINQAEHAKTRHEIQQEGKRVTASNRDSNRLVADAVDLVEVHLQDTLELSSETNSIQHEQTQSQIASVKKALRQLSEQLQARDQELRDILAALDKSTSKKKRKLLRERSKAVTAAILALQTMYRNLREKLEKYQSRVEIFIQKAQSSELWLMTRHAHKSTSSSESGIEMRPPEYYTITGMGDRYGQSKLVQKTCYYAHEIYFGYYYQWLDKHSILVNPVVMERKWYFREERLNTSDALYANYEGICVDDSFCDNEILWLLAAVNAAIIRNIAPDIASFNLISKVFDRLQTNYNDGKAYSDGRLSSRLREDMGYWRSFAKTRGMLNDSTSYLNSTEDLINLNDEHESNVEPESTSEPKFSWGHLTAEELQDLDNLLHWLIGSPDVPHWSQKTSTLLLTPDGPAVLVAETLGSMGLRIFTENNIHELKLNSSPRITVRYSEQESQQSQIRQWLE
ncbi:hypothetical protein F4679DRAFT_587244 [Xylaria curta]|nr:hypothetical protein F4679DRAFT_587244 [Xylaria curta]